MAVNQSEVYRDDAEATSNVAHDVLKTLRNLSDAMPHLPNHTGNCVPINSKISPNVVWNINDRCCPALQSRLEQ
jgi:hypothetical protein